MSKINVTAGSASAYGAGELQLNSKAPMSATLTLVTDNLNTASQLKLSTTLTQVAGTLQIAKDGGIYIDAQDTTGVDRFNVNRGSASQQVNIDFASLPTDLTTAVGAIRTATDGVNLANVMTFLENGKVGIGTSAPTSVLQIKGSGTTSATTSLLVQNSASTQLLKINDVGDMTVNGNIGLFTFSSYFVFYGSGSYQSGTYLSGAAFSTNGPITANVTGSANASAMLQADSTTRGFLPPRMTTTQKNAIASPAAGLMVYDTNLNKLCVYTTAWETVTSI